MECVLRCSHNTLQADQVSACKLSWPQTKCLIPQHNLATCNTALSQVGISWWPLEFMPGSDFVALLCMQKAFSDIVHATYVSRSALASVAGHAYESAACHEN